MVKKHKKPQLRKIIPKREKPQLEYSPGTVFVSNLPSSCTDSKLKDAFSDVGPLKHSFLFTKTNQEGELMHLGFGVVQFTDVEDAARSIELKHRTLMDGRKIHVKLAKYRPPKPNQGAESDGTLKTENETDVPIQPPKKAKKRKRSRKGQAGEGKTLKTENETDVPIQPPKKAKKRKRSWKVQAGEGKSSEKQTCLENKTDSAPHDAKITVKPTSAGETGKPVQTPKKVKKPVKGKAGDGRSSKIKSHLENETDSAPHDVKIAKKPPRKRKADDQSVDNKDGKSSKNRSKNK